MLAEAFQEIVMGLSRFKAAIADLEKEHKNTQETILSLQKRIQVLEETSAADGIDVELIDRILENYDLESKIDSVLDMRLDDAIESALSGREVEINFNGTVTL